MHNHYHAKQYNPVIFYSLTFAISWICWGIAAYISYQPNAQTATLIWALVGLLGPMLAALLTPLITRERKLFYDYCQRLLLINTISLNNSLLIIFIMLAVLILATAISLLFGLSVTQFWLSPHFVISLPILLTASIFEELGWRSYGMDSLLAGHKLFTASLYFALLWGLWHIPLFFINQTYQHGLTQMGWYYVINFFISIVPAVFLANWFFYQAKRSIPAAVLFHFLLNFSAELLQTAPETKFIITGLLLIVSTILIITKHQLFFNQINACNNIYFMQKK